METQVTPDTTLYTYTCGGQSIDGLTLLDSILGNQSAQEYARLSADHTEAENMAQLCGWLQGMLWPNGGFYLSEAQAESATTDEFGESELRSGCNLLESFTPASIHRDVCAAGVSAANEEAEENIEGPDQY